MLKANREAQLEQIKNRVSDLPTGQWFADGAIDLHAADGGELAAVWDGGNLLEFFVHSKDDMLFLLTELDRAQKALSVCKEHSSESDLITSTVDKFFEGK